MFFNFNLSPSTLKAHMHEIDFAVHGSVFKHANNNLELWNYDNDSNIKTKNNTEAGAMCNTVDQIKCKTLKIRQICEMPMDHSNSYEAP